MQQDTKYYLVEVQCRLLLIVAIVRLALQRHHRHLRYNFLKQYQH
jgi:hypothetical protein